MAQKEQTKLLKNFYSELPFKNEKLGNGRLKDLLLFGFKISFPVEKDLSIAALDGMAVLYFCILKTKSFKRLLRKV